MQVTSNKVHVISCAALELTRQPMVSINRRTEDYYRSWHRPMESYLRFIRYIPQ